MTPPERQYSAIWYPLIYSMTVLANTAPIISMPQISHRKTTARHFAPEAKKAIALNTLSGMGIAHAAKKNAFCRNSVNAQKTKANPPRNGTSWRAHQSSACWSSD